MSEREWEFYLDDMIKFCKKILSYTEQLDKKGFEYSRIIRKLNGAKQQAFGTF